MNVKSLTLELKQVLNAIFGICESYFLPDIIEKCLLWQSELESPLKVAIVGITSAGKSTLLNALIKRDIVPTGAETLTYNINIMRHISRSPLGEECLIAHLKDGSTQNMPISELSLLVDGRNESTLRIRNQIEWVEAYVKYDYLKDIDLIDTPGLLSIKQYDSKNTMNLFNDEDRKPDVCIYLMQRAIHLEDVKAVRAFQKEIGTNSKISGLNTIAALTHCDYLCHGDYSKDFHAEGKRIIDDNRTRYEGFRRCFSKVFTLAAIYAQVAYKMTDIDFDIINKIQECIYNEIIEDLYDKTDFIENDNVFGAFIGSRDERARFINRINMAVLKYCVWWLRQNRNSSLFNLREHLIEISGVKNMDEYIFSNFKRLAIYFKSLKFVRSLRKSIEYTSNKYYDIHHIEALEKIQIICRNFEVKLQQSFSYLSVLVDYFNENTYFNEKDWNIVLQVVDDCLSDFPNIKRLKENRDFLVERKRYYGLLSDLEAVESCKKLIDKIENLI